MKREIVSDKSTIDRIIDAAIPLFAMKGYAAVSVKELAQAADVNIALISYYFGGKENLYATVLKAQFVHVTEFIEVLTKEDASPIEKIRHFAQMAVEYHGKHPYTSYLIYGEIINPTVLFDQVVKKETSQGHRFLCKCIQEAIALGEFRSDLDPDYAALSLISIIHFYFFTKHLSQGNLEPRENQAEYYITQAVETYLYGVMRREDI